HRIVTEPAAVPRWIERLHIAGLVGRSAGQLVLAGLCIPSEAPTAPRISAGYRLERRLLPFAVDTNLHLGHRHSATGPSPAEQLDGTAIDQPPPGEPIRNTRRNHKGFHTDMRDRSAWVPTVLAINIRPNLLIPIKWAVQHLDAIEPLH